MKEGYDIVGKPNHLVSIFHQTIQYLDSHKEQLEDIFKEIVPNIL